MKCSSFARVLARVAIALSAIASQSSLVASDWVFYPSTFSHDPPSGQRIEQFAPKDPVYAPDRGNYLRSGFRYTNSTLQVGGSFDSYNLVDQWGGEVRPYGEWLYPYRPYSVPYDQWGPPFGGANGEFNEQGFGMGWNGGGRRNGWGGGGWGAGGWGGGGGWNNRGRGNFAGGFRANGRINGLFDGQGIPGDDGHYIQQPRRLEQMNDREFFRQPNARN